MAYAIKDAQDAFLASPTRAKCKSCMDALNKKIKMYFPAATEARCEYDNGEHSLAFMEYIITTAADFQARSIAEEWLCGRALRIVEEVRRLTIQQIEQEDQLLLQKHTAANESQNKNKMQSVEILKKAQAIEQEQSRAVGRMPFCDAKNNENAARQKAKVPVDESVRGILVNGKAPASPAENDAANCVDQSEMFDVRYSLSQLNDIDQLDSTAGAQASGAVPGMPYPKEEAYGREKTAEQEGLSVYEMALRMEDGRAGQKRGSTLSYSTIFSMLESENKKCSSQNRQSAGDGALLVDRRPGARNDSSQGKAPRARTGAQGIPAREYFDCLLKDAGDEKHRYTAIVRKLCVFYRLLFPEYEIVRENDVYRCTATFCNMNFVSSYEYDRADAKDGACRKIHGYVGENWEMVFQVDREQQAINLNWDRAT